MKMNEFILISALIFIYGVYSLISKKNLIKSLIGIILMIESSHLLFISISPANPLTQYFVIISIVISGGLMATIIGFMITIYRRKGTLKTKVLNVS